MNLTMLSTLHIFVVFFTVLQLAHGAIGEGDVLMAFTFEGGDDKLGQVADSVLKDVSGNGHDGEFKKSPKWAEGVWGAGLEVGPAGKGLLAGWNAVTVPHTDDMDLQEFAIAAWVKVEELIGGCCGMIVSKENWGANGIRNYSMWMREQVTVGFTTRNPFNDVQARSIVITDGKWHHAVGTYNGQILAQYVDGVAYGKAPFAEQNPAFHLSERLHIGAMGPNGTRLGMAGFVDEVAIFNRGLTEAEVNDLMNNGLENILGFQPVNPRHKMATTWAKLKSNE